MTPQELEAFADPATSDADNDAVIAAVAKCQKVMRNLKPRLILSVALKLKDWAETLGANQVRERADAPLLSSGLSAREVALLKSCQSESSGMWASP